MNTTDKQVEFLKRFRKRFTTDLAFMRATREMARDEIITREAYDEISKIYGYVFLGSKKQKDETKNKKKIPKNNSVQPVKIENNKTEDKKNYVDPCSPYCPRSSPC